MISVNDLGKHAELVIGANERAILNAATDVIMVPSSTNIRDLLIAKDKVGDLTFESELLGLSPIEFARHKSNLLQEMDEAIKAALES
ncbi:hypothetical protein [Photobacterium leiognathi]|uniref:hypothetical protein n=1 Tax=Photobacterium leiognathi TaxID=553611 RepID=UPI00298207F7|nr:hypothetical protein [Photobacterium leiognathi]